MSISEKLKQARAATDLTQESVAEKVGVSRQTVYNWEQGKSYPDITSIMILSDIYNVTVDSLLKGDTEMIKHLEENPGKEKKVRYVIISIIALIIVMLFIWMSVALLGTSVTHIIDPPSLYLLLLPLIFVLTITRSYKLFYLGLRALILPKRQISEEERLKTISLFRLMSKTVAIAAAILTVAFVISMLLNISLFDTEFSHDMILRSIATLLIAPLYSLVMILVVFEPVVFILKRK
jgi:transcriptional regulator with XRE-family HTH domain